MRKLLAWLLLLCLTLGLAAACAPACTPAAPGSTEDPGKTETTGKEPEEAPAVQCYPYTDEDGVLHIRYRDTYTFSEPVLGKREETVASTVCGSEAADAAVVRLVGDTVEAVGCGRVTLILGGGERSGWW